MAHRILLRDLGGRPPEEIEATLMRLADESAQHPDASRTLVEDRIRAFESRYEMSSEQLHAALQAGNMKETADISEWLFYLETLDCGISA